MLEINYTESKHEWKGTLQIWAHIFSKCILCNSAYLIRINTH